MTPRTRAEAALLGTAAIWGGTFVVSKIGLHDVPPMTMVTLRFLLATLLFVVIYPRRVFRWPGSTAVKGAVLGGLLFFGFVAQTSGLVYTTASKSAFITGMMVVIVPLMQIFVERRPPKLGNIAGVVVVTTGLWLLTSPEGSSFNAGDAMTLGCAVIFAAYIIYLDISSKTEDTIQLSFVQVLVAALLGIVAIGLGGEVHGSFTAEALGAIAYLAILASFWTTIIQTRYQKETTPTRAVIIFMVEPVVAALLSALVLGDRPGGAGIAGGALILGGVLLSELSDGIPLLNLPLPVGRPQLPQ